MCLLCTIGGQCEGCQTQFDAPSVLLRCEACETLWCTPCAKKQGFTDAQKKKAVKKVTRRTGLPAYYCKGCLKEALSSRVMPTARVAVTQRSPRLLGKLELQMPGLQITRTAMLTEFDTYDAPLDIEVSVFAAAVDHKGAPWAGVDVVEITPQGRVFAFTSILRSPDRLLFSYVPTRAEVIIIDAASTLELQADEPVSRPAISQPYAYARLTAPVHDPTALVRLRNLVARALSFTFEGLPRYRAQALQAVDSTLLGIFEDDRAELDEARPPKE